MRKSWVQYVVTLFLVLVLVVGVSWFISPFLSKAQKVTPLSPLPSFLTRVENNQVTTLDLWQPLRQAVLGITIIREPTLTAKSAVAYDLTTDTPLLNKNSSERVPMASLTKIMTAIVGLEHQQPNDTYLVPQAAIVGEDSMGLDVGEKLSLQELLYGLVLHSGNDAAETIAANFPGGREKFIVAMNDKAKALGLRDTHFTNPSGLEGDGNQYTTAYDLLVITRFALEHFSTFREVVSTFDYTIPATNTHKEYVLENETNLLTSYPGVKGVKDGYTPEAGLCLVTYLDYGGHQILGIVLGSDDRRTDMKDLLDYSLKRDGVIPPHHL